MCKNHEVSHNGFLTRTFDLENIKSRTKILAKKAPERVGSDECPEWLKFKHQLTRVNLVQETMF